jgi:Tfp pilus assembly protein PilF
LQTAIENRPDQFTLKGMMAELYRQSEEKDKAWSLYEELLEDYTDRPNLHLSYFDFLAEEKEYELMKEKAGEIIENEGITVEDKVSVIVRMLNIQEFRDKYKEDLEKVTKQFSTIYPDDATVVLLLSEVYSNTGKNREAIDVLKNFVNNDDSQYFVWESLLVRINEEGNNDELYTYSKECSKKFNKMPLPKMMLAFAAIEREEYDLGKEELEKVRILVNDQNEFIVQVLSLEAEIEYRQNRPGKAWSKFDEALSIDEDNALILNNYAYYLAEESIELKKAQKMIERCLEKEKNATYMDTFAWILYKQSKYKQALEVMKEIFENVPVYDADILEHYGFIQAANNNCKEAVVLWQAALKADSEKKELIKEIKDCIGKD